MSGQLGTTRLSSKGQVVIPEEIRAQMKLEAGDKFVVMGDQKQDVIILKVIQQPSLKDFEMLAKEARRQARAAGMKQTEVAKAIKAVRTDKRRKK